MTEENLISLFENAGIICEAFDNPEAKAMLVNGILEHFPEKNWCPHPEWPGMEAAIQFVPGD